MCKSIGCREVSARQRKPTPKFREDKAAQNRGSGRTLRLNVPPCRTRHS
jgi:hypothetical protein